MGAKNTKPNHTNPIAEIEQEIESELQDKEKLQN